jgi:uncharacterized protein YfaT (DUF1175 family)
MVVTIATKKLRQGPCQIFRKADGSRLPFFAKDAKLVARKADMLTAWLKHGS